MLNRVVLVGRLTRDPELRKTNSEKSVASFTLAVDNRGKTPDGKKTASFIPIVVWNDQATNVCKYVRKGSLVGVDGHISQRSYDRKDGTKASVLEVIADSVQFLEPKAAEAAENAVNPTSEEISQVAPADNNKEEKIDDASVIEEDLPF